MSDYSKDELVTLLNKTIKKVKEKTAQYEAIIASKDDEMEGIKREMIRVNREKDHNLSEVDVLRSRVSQKEEDVRELESQLAQTKQENETMSEAASQLQEALTSCETRSGDLEERLTASEERKGVLEIQVLSYEDHVDQLEKQIQSHTQEEEEEEMDEIDIIIKEGEFEVKMKVGDEDETSSWCLVRSSERVKREGSEDEEEEESAILETSSSFWILEEDLVDKINRFNTKFQSSDDDEEGGEIQNSDVMEDGGRSSNIIFSLPSFTLQEEHSKQISLISKQLQDQITSVSNELENSKQAFNTYRSRAQSSLKKTATNQRESEQVFSFFILDFQYSFLFDFQGRFLSF